MITFSEKEGQAMTSNDKALREHLVTELLQKRDDPPFGIEASMVAADGDLHDFKTSGKSRWRAWWTWSAHFS